MRAITGSCVESAAYDIYVDVQVRPRRFLIIFCVESRRAQSAAHGDFECTVGKIDGGCARVITIIFDHQLHGSAFVP